MTSQYRKDKSTKKLNDRHKISFIARVEDKAKLAVDVYLFK